jgi:hypothetical protein
MINMVIDTRGKIYSDILVVLALVVLSGIRVWLVRDGIWDDNAWLLSKYATEGPQQFLDTGFVEVRRIPLGIFLYVLFQIHYLSDYFYVAWHALDVITQAGSPVLLYLILRKQFPEHGQLALFAAVSLVVFPLDYTIGYASGSSYRVGFLFFIASVYATQHAFADARIRPLPLITAIAASAASYTLIESVIALEPARASIIAHLLYRAGFRHKALFGRLVYRYTPFALVGLLLVIYKLTFRPFGIYEGIYNFDPLFLFRVWDTAKSIAHLLFAQWLLISKFLDAIQVSSVMLGFLATALVLKLPGGHTSRPPNNAGSVPNAVPSPSTPIIILGLVFLVPPVIMVQAFSRPISWGMNSSHAIPAQIGYAILLGWLLHRVYAHACVRRRPWRKAAVASFIGLGIFFNNANIDMFLDSWRQQSRFWHAFTERFPTLPERATFFFDIQDGALYSDLVNYYDFEFQLNLLYATSADPAAFRRYKAYTAAELIETRGKTPKELLSADTIERLTHLGPDRLQPAEFIVVRYRNGKLLVNGEITRADPGVSYRAWADKSVPITSSSPASYPLRGKLEFAY